MLKHIGLIKKFVYIKTKDKELHEELIQVGMLGLVEAQERYDNNKCNSGKFISYAAPFAIGRIKQYIRDNINKHKQKYCRVNEETLGVCCLEEQIIKEELLAQYFKRAARQRSA